MFHSNYIKDKHEKEKKEVLQEDHKDTKREQRDTKRKTASPKEAGR